jgi:hypothetical protein
MAPATFTNIYKSYKTAKIALPSAGDRIQFLTDAGIKPPGNTPAKELIERCATLAWSRDSLSDYRRLAYVIESWIPAGQPGATPPQPVAAAPLAPGAPINIARHAGPVAPQAAAAPVLRIKKHNKHNKQKRHHKFNEQILKPI